MIFLYQDYKEFDVDGQATFVLCNVYLDLETNDIVYVPVATNHIQQFLVEQITLGEVTESTVEETQLNEFPTIIDNLLKS